MVHIEKNNTCEEFHAYLSSSLSADTLNDIHSVFAVGAFSRFAPMVELVIHDEPSYYNYTAEALRKAVDDAALQNLTTVSDGKEIAQVDSTDIVQIPSDWDKSAGRTAVWYIGSWADEEQISEDQVIQHGDSPVLWKLLTELVDVPLRWMNYSIANMSLQEDVDMYPYDAEEIQVLRGPICDYDVVPWGCSLVAQPGEYESIGGNESGIDMLPLQKTLYRLKPEIAVKVGLLSRWMPGRIPEGWPDGSIAMTQDYDTSSDVWKNVPVGKVVGPTAT